MVQSKLLHEKGKIVGSIFWAPGFAAWSLREGDGNPADCPLFFLSAIVPEFMVMGMANLASDDLVAHVRSALAEDLGTGDVTSLAVVPEEAMAAGVMMAREELVVAGLPIAEVVFKEISKTIAFERLVQEGQKVGKGTALARVQGRARDLLAAERVSLNYLQRLSGVATLTGKYVEAVAGTGAAVLDTRKTTPGWRVLEKYAVRCGGGQNHRIGLFDMVLIKDNHLAVLRAEGDPVKRAVQRAREKYPGLKVEVEADTFEQVKEAMEAGADCILLDNMSLEELREAVRLVDGRAQTEASGGINLATARAVAETGVDFISVGALTHSAVAVDIALDFSF
jgi:nicotinate-nucleotide pyrophosphorylase (carboxylating)